MTINIPSLSQIDTAAQTILKNIPQNPVLAFHGALGSGKTTLIKAMCHALGSPDNVTSPTFAIINEYADKDNNPIYHFDLYRITTLTELKDTGAEEYFDSGYTCFIEWPELAQPILPENTTHIYIKINENGTRTIQL